MGAGIALVAARAGFDVVAYDVTADGLARAAADTESFLANSVARGRMTAEAREETLRRLTTTTDIGELAAADLVVEAVYEELAVKRALLGQLDDVCGDGTIFASNTSTLSITEIAAGSRRPDRVVGLHFCLPAQLMRLIEVSPGYHTSEEVLDRAWAWTLAAGQTPVRTQDKPGFILNALIVPFNNDAIRAVEAGLAEPAAIDAAVKGALGYRMGPLELVDLVGIDTQLRLCEAFYPATLDPRAAAPPLLRRMAAAGALGRKVGRGFYRYDGSSMFGA